MKEYQDYSTKETAIHLIIMIIGVLWGFIGGFWAILMFFAGDTSLIIMSITGITAFIGLCLPAIFEFIYEGSVDLTPRFLK